VPMADIRVNSRNSVLVISFSFAPNARVGGKRFSFLSEMLAGFPLDLHILTLKEEHIPDKDHSIPFSGMVHRAAMVPYFPRQDRSFLGRAFSRFWISHLSMLDPYSGWIAPAVAKGIAVIKRHEIDTIVATGPPFSSMVVALFLHRITGVPFILDYRDPWSNRKKNVNYCRPFGKKLNVAMERRAINRASALVFNAKAMREEFHKTFGDHVSAFPSTIIPNGYHPRHTVEPLKLEPGRRQLIYAGKLYDERSIDPIAKALNRVIAEGVVSRSDLRFHVFGRMLPADKERVKAAGLEEVIVEHDPVPYETIIRYLRGSDILVLIVGDKMSYSVSYKFYDYLSVRRPILALVPRNSQMVEMMESIDCGQYAYADDPDSVYASIREMLLGTRKYSFSGAEQYTWREAAFKYNDLIATVCESGDFAKPTLSSPGHPA
jgi:glycosyltransferase involved in cell wall biosynthesis